MKWLFSWKERLSREPIVRDLLLPLPQFAPLFSVLWSETSLGWDSAGFRGRSLEPTAFDHLRVDFLFTPWLSFVSHGYCLFAASQTILIQGPALYKHCDLIESTFSFSQKNTAEMRSLSTYAVETLSTQSYCRCLYCIVQFSNKGFNKF